MKKQDVFTETKIKMVMKLKKLTHAAAVKEIARMDMLRRQEAEAQRQAEEAQRHHGGDLSRAMGEEEDDGEMISAEEFFGAN